MNNVIVRLIEQKMAEDGWDATIPAGYASYLFNLTDEEIVRAVEQIDD